MTKEFISYEQALELKQLGFDEPCLAFYPIYEIQDKRHPIKEGTLVMINQGTDYWGEMYYTDDIETTDLCHLYQCAAPLYQQAFRWFREKYKLVALIDIGMHEFSYKIFKNEKSITPFKDYLDYNGTYEEAELECLKKLIEIVNTK